MESFMIYYTSIVNNVSFRSLVNVNMLIPLIVANHARQQPAAATSQNLFGGGNDNTGN